jgi:hypothetical protein
MDPSLAIILVKLSYMCDKILGIGTMLVCDESYKDGINGCLTPPFTGGGHKKMGCTHTHTHTHTHTQLYI